MFERILERISVSKYNENFILKGGLLLSAMLGINSRTTRDIDISIKGIDVSKDKMVKILNEILSINIGDNVKFNIIDISDIRVDDEYGGNKYHLVGKLENSKVNLEIDISTGDTITKVNLEIDISTGDTITPKELNFEYISIFENKKIYIESYNIETILAEKIETILRRGKYNTRMKDYYDIYFFLIKLRNEIDLETFKQALNITLLKREAVNYYKDYKQILKEILADSRVNNYWVTYRNKNKYAENIEFKEIVKELKKFLDKNNQ